MNNLNPCSVWYFIPSNILIIIKASTRNILYLSPHTRILSLPSSCLNKKKLAELSHRIYFFYIKRCLLNNQSYILLIVVIMTSITCHILKKWWKIIKDDSFSLCALTQVISFLISVQLIVQIHPSPYPLSNSTCGDHFSKQNGQKKCN